MSRHSIPVLFSFVLFASACGGTPSIDPRCESLCRAEEPSAAGSGDVCSPQSVEDCKATCTERIADGSSLCGTCLLEKSRFEVPASESSSDFCTSDPTAECAGGTCSMTGREGECTYCSGDDQGRENCLKQVYPRREVYCTPTFRPVEECAAMCVADA